MVAALESPQNSPPERLSGSQKPTTGLSDLAWVCGHEVHKQVGEALSSA